jgi:hypothetical protein
MMDKTQMGFCFDLKAERTKRDRALNLLEATRGDILDAARQAAMDLIILNGRVTAPEVFTLMRERGFEEVLSRVDPRFMGAVFREGQGWRRVGWENKGSHRRPVSIWVKQENKRASSA